MFPPDLLGPDSMQPPGLGPGGLAPGGGFIMPQPPASVPQPGESYKIQPGDSLFATITSAYGIGPGATRIEAARRVSDHPINRANVTYYYPTSGNEASWFPNGRISFGAPYQTFYFPTVAQLGL